MNMPASNHDDAFVAAMGDALASVDGTPPAAAPAAEPAPAPAAEVTPAPAAAEAPPAAEPAAAASAEPAPTPAGDATPAAGAPVAEPAAAPAPAPAAEPTLDPAVSAAIAAAVAAAKPQEPAPAAAPAAEPTPPEEEKPLSIDQFLTDDDKKVLDAYDKEWGEVSQAEQIRRRAEMQLMQAHMFREVGKVLAPMVAAMQQSQVTSHFQAIRSAHPDFDAVLPGVQDWVAKQPSIYRPALDRVLKSGSAHEVVELVAAYKQAVGQTGAVPATPASSVPQATSAAAPAAPPAVAAAPAAPTAAPAAAVAATAAVVSQRSGAQQAADPNDFNAALREALGA